MEARQVKLTTTKLATKLLAGKTIARVSVDRFEDGRGGIATDPIIVLDDGSILYFTVSETEVGEYGITLHRGLPQKKPCT